MTLNSVLVVGDEASIRDNMTLLLGNETTNRNNTTFILADLFAVIHADNAEDALLLAQRHHPDVVLLDLVRAGASSLTIARQIKAACPETAILVVISAATDLPSVGDGNIDAALAKPFDHDELLDVVRLLCPVAWTTSDETIW